MKILILIEAIEHPSSTLKMALLVSRSRKTLQSTRGLVKSILMSLTQLNEIKKKLKKIKLKILVNISRNRI